LIGLAVINREGVVLGEVVEVQDFGAQPLLRIVSAGGDGLRRVERLIPYVPVYVERVDLAARRIDVDWQADY
jgi:16S rRNA processing protein RimM